MQQKFFYKPFAVAGDMTIVPDVHQTDGSLSFNDGWTPPYSLELADPTARKLERDVTNYLFNVVTTAIAALQMVGVPEWITSVNNGGASFPYAKGSHVRYSATPLTGPWVEYVSTVDANTDTPGTTTAWQVALIYAATASDITAGTSGSLVVTPLALNGLAKGGTVTSVSGAGGGTGLTLSGGPITSSGTLTLGGTLAIANGGTGAITAALAILALGGVDLVSAQTIGGAKTFSSRPIVQTATAGTNDAGAASTAYVLAAIAATMGSPVKQAILAGPTDSNGFFTPGGTTGAASITTTGITGSAPLVVNAAGGYLASGLSGDRIGASSSNFTFGSFSNGQNYLYVDVATGGALTAGSGTLIPTYQRGGSASITNNQFTYNADTKKQTVGNGSAAVQSYRVYLGEATVTAGVVTAIIWYRLNNKFVSAPFANPNASGSVSTVNSNLGLPNNMIKRQYAMGVIPSAVDGWAAGTVFEIFAGNTLSTNPVSIQTRNTATLQTGASASNGLYYQTTPGGATQSLPASALITVFVEGDL